MSKRHVEDSGLTPHKKIKAIQHYRQEYHERWSCFLRSRKGDSFILCTVCNIDFTCTHDGGNDCKRHVESIRHKDNESLKKFLPSCLKFLETKQGEGQQDVITAEAMMCDLLVEHNLPFAAADTFTKAVKHMFPNSKIARGKQ